MLKVHYNVNVKLSGKVINLFEIDLDLLADGCGQRHATHMVSDPCIGGQFIH